MNRESGSPRRLTQGLRRLLGAIEAGDMDLSGDPALFLVGLKGLSPSEAEAWLSRVVRSKGRILWNAALEPGTPGSAPSKPRSTGVGPEEKSILWGK